MRSHSTHHNNRANESTSTIFTVTCLLLGYDLDSEEGETLLVSKITNITGPSFK